MNTINMYRVLFLKLLLILISASSCSDDDTNTNSNTNPDQDTPDTSTSETTLSQIAQDTPNTITWVSRAAMTSRDGSSMGYGVILNPNSQNVLIFLDGGGACYNPITCSGNVSNYSETDFNTDFSEEDALILNRNSSDNPFRDWNIVFIPYATGDVHSGTNPSADVAFNGPTDQVMTGYNNVTQVLNDVKQYFDTTAQPINEIVFSGSSAGGYGTLFNVVQFADVFGTDLQTTVLVDSGQLFLNDNILTPCLEAQWSNLWLWENTLPSDLNTVVEGTYAYDVQKLYEYVAVTYPNYNFGFLSTYEDDVIRGFYSFGQNNCPPIPPALIDGNTFKTGLLELKETVLDLHDNWKVFYSNGNGHTFLGSPTLNQTANGTTLNQWITDLRNGVAVDVMD